jgi:hypothetical protein
MKSPLVVVNFTWTVAGAMAFKVSGCSNGFTAGVLAAGAADFVAGAADLAGGGV